jgi:hypothetical protein
MPSPLDMPARRIVAPAARVIYSTDTLAARRDRAILAAAKQAQRAAERDCPGCTGETSKTIGARLGCTFCTL